MMQKMGWSEGTGLGRNNDGVLTHVKMKKRSEEIGKFFSKLKEHNNTIF